MDDVRQRNTTMICRQTCSYVMCGFQQGWRQGMERVAGMNPKWDNESVEYESAMWFREVRVQRAPNSKVGQHAPRAFGRNLSVYCVAGVAGLRGRRQGHSVAERDRRGAVGGDA